ncbi:hypothetical protein H6P81_003520 [Aristolochia fimbriata]|uniref:DYW domain-containing protein n=1 Tax=Aristolochia fimbriata TaxID=158543 RepID=A0AAV7FG38_ARIFI|nr:hypothetical protein H6P81_003520 [Aristolochia fimbriata]
MFPATLCSVQLPPSFPKLTQQHKNFQTDSLTTHLVSNFNCPFELKQVHAHFIKTKTPLSTLTLSRVAMVCSSSPAFDYAHKMFRHVDNQEIVLWNSCLRSFAEGNSPIEAFRLLRRIRLVDLFPDTFTCSFAIKACSKLLALAEGRVIHALVEKLGFKSDLFLLNTIVHMYASCGAMEDACCLFTRMVERDVVTWNIMITQFTKLGDMGTARDLFDEMPMRSVRSWTAMIAGYVQCGKPKEATRLFIEMEEAGVEPNEVFHEMEERSVVSWSAMIGGLAIHGQAEEALRLFKRMSKIGIRPNGVTIIGLLLACSHMGLIDEGRKYFASMTKDYGIIPQIEHYGCMVDLLSRTGLLEEAHEFIKNMPIKPNSVVWGALLGGCKVHKNVKLGEEAIKHLQELDPLNDGYYVVLSNIYAEAGRWEDAARVRRLMRERGVKKTPGWSTMAVNGVVHEFVAGDGSHPNAQEIYEKWEELLHKLKAKGYVPNTSVVLLDMDENEKENVLYRHSEKLAVVFGLISTSPGTPLRIMKNLRVCEDCHAALKLISEISGRQIVLRDRNRFHSFMNGICSCKDYW